MRGLVADAEYPDIVHTRASPTSYSSRTRSKQSEGRLDVAFAFVLMTGMFRASAAYFTVMKGNPSQQSTRNLSASVTTRNHHFHIDLPIPRHLPTTPV